MKLKKLLEYPCYESNPFDTDSDGIRKYVVESENIASMETGEILVTAEAKYIDHKKFVKLFIEGLPILRELGIKAYRVLMLMLEDLGKEEDEVLIPAKYYINELGYKNTRDVYDGIKELMERKILVRSTKIDHYFVNVRVLYNGNRAKFHDKKLSE